MKAIILVGGFATRLFPLTKHVPKALLPLGDKAVLDYIMEKLQKVKEIDEIIIVGNSCFASNFEEWKDIHNFDVKIDIVNDDGKDNNSKPGALGGLRYALQRKQFDDDIFLLAGDNYFDFELDSFIEFYRKRQHNCVLGGKFEDLTYLGKNFGVVELNEKDEVIGMEEKPIIPKSDIGLYAFYLFKSEIRQKLELYFKEGNNPEALGYFIKWLSRLDTVDCYVTKEKCFDIGTLDMYSYVQEYVKTKI